jgi:single stranded DNA-binding protein
MNGIACALQGRVGSEPEMRYTQGGRAMLSFSVAVHDTKAVEGVTEWVKCVLWGEDAERLNGTLAKGSELYIEGRLKLSTWQAQDGQQRSGLDVSVWTCAVMGAIGRKAPRRDDRGDGRTADPATTPTQRRVMTAAAVGAERARNGYGQARPYPAQPRSGEPSGDTSALPF